MTDLFLKSLADLKLPDFASELRKATPLPNDGALSSQQIQNLNRLPNLTALAALTKKREKAAEEVMPATLPSWTARVSQIQGYDQLPASQQVKMYNDFIRETTDSLKTIYPKLDEFDIEDALRKQSPAPKMPERGFGELATDIARSAYTGVLSIPKSLSDLIDPNSQLSAEIQQEIVDTKANQSAKAKNTAKEIALQTQQIYEQPDVGAVSALLQEAGVAIKNLSPEAFAELAGNIIPTLALTAGTGFAVRGTALAAGLTEARAAVAATGAVKSVGAAMTAGEASGAAYQSVMDMPLAQLQASPEWAEALTKANGDEQGARTLLANDAANIARVVGAGVGLIGFAPGSLESTVGRAVSGKSVSGIAKRGVEAAIEGVEEGAGAVASNVGVQQAVDPNQRLLEGAGAESVLGALGGAGGGAIVSAIAGDKADTVTPPPTTGSTSTATDLFAGEVTAEPTVSTDPVVTERPVVAGTAQEVQGATLVEQADGSWAYAPDSEPNDIADEVIKQSRAEVGAVDPPTPANNDFIEALTPDVQEINSQLEGVEDIFNEENVANTTALLETVPTLLENLKAALAASTNRESPLAKLAEFMGVGRTEFQTEEATYTLDGNGQATRDSKTPITGPVVFVAPSNLPLIKGINMSSKKLERTESGDWQVTQGEKIPVELVTSTQPVQGWLPVIVQKDGSRVVIGQPILPRGQSPLQIDGSRQQPAAPRTEVSPVMRGITNRITESFRAGGMSAREYMSRLLALNPTSEKAVRGAQPTIDLIRQSIENGKIPRAQGELALWMLEQNPALAENLMLLPAASSDPREGGAYFSIAELVRLNRSDERVETLVHEILHHTERMLPREMQLAITEEWKKAVQRAYEAAPEGSVAKRMLPLTVEAGLRRGTPAGNEAYRTLINTIGRGDFDLDTYYQLINPTEFWAVNGSELINQKANGIQPEVTEAQPASIWESIREWYEKLREFFVKSAPEGEQSAVVKAIDFILDPANVSMTNSQFRTRTMVRSAANVDLLTGVDSMPVADAAVRDQEAVSEGADNIMGDFSIPSVRGTALENINAVTAGTPVAPATLTRAAVQGGWKARGKTLQDFGSWLNVKLADHLAPFVSWLKDLPVSDTLINNALGALRTAPARRNNVLQTGIDKHGGRDVQKLIAAAASKNKITIESATKWMGEWVTAQYVPIANARLLRLDQKAVDEAQAEADRAQKLLASKFGIPVTNFIAAARDAAQQAEIDASPEQKALTAAIIKLVRAQKQLKARADDINNSNLGATNHKVGVAGYTNAQARALAAAAEKHISKDDMKALAEKLYDLNAWKLSVDIETGKTAPFIAAEFLERPDLLKPLTELHNLASNVDAKDANSVAALEAKRAQVIKAVRSKYVPLTGDPNAAMEADIFTAGTQQPNTARNFAMKGRTNSIPDDAVTATWASVLKSSGYAGWAGFQDAIADIHNNMTKDQRNAVGLHRKMIDGTGGMIGRSAIVRRRGGKTEAFFFDNPQFLESIRNANMDDNSHMAGVVGSLTKAYAYAATQLNPFFGVRNAWRDLWERSELIRTRKYLDANGKEVDSTKLGDVVRSYMYNPARNWTLFRTAHRHSLGIPDKTKEGRYLEEFLATGGMSLFRDKFAPSRSQLIADIANEQGIKAQRRKLAKFIQGYNNHFDIGPGLASYMAMREAGMTPDAASAGARDLMDFNKRGEAMPYINALYAFAQPSITGGANVIGALQTARGRNRLIAYTLVMAAAQAAFRELADDDEGGNRLDQQSAFMHNNNILIPYGKEGVLKIPLAFGTTRLANGMARAMLGLSTKEQTLDEAFGNFVTGTVVPVFVPLEDVAIDGKKNPVQAMLATFLPTTLKPVVMVGMNMSSFGSPIVADKYEDTAQYKSEQFGDRIPPEYKEIAQEIRKLTGIDFAPEQVRALIRGYPMGPGTMLLNGMVENPYKSASGKKFDGLIERQIFSHYSDSAAYFKFRDAVDEAGEIMKRDAAGDTDLTDLERQQLRWRQKWDDIEKGFSAKKGAITRNKGLTEAAKTARKDRLQKEKEQAQMLALYQYRSLLGKDTQRVEVPAEFMP